MDIIYVNGDKPVHPSQPPEPVLTPNGMTREQPFTYNSHSQSQSILFKLPAEVREQIYSHVFPRRTYRHGAWSSDHAIHMYHHSHCSSPSRIVCNRAQVDCMWPHVHQDNSACHSTCQRTRTELKRVMTIDGVPQNFHPIEDSWQASFGIDRRITNILLVIKYVRRNQPDTLLDTARAMVRNQGSLIFRDSPSEAWYTVTVNAALDQLRHQGRESPKSLRLYGPKDCAEDRYHQICGCNAKGAAKILRTCQQIYWEAQPYHYDQDFIFHPASLVSFGAKYLTARTSRKIHTLDVIVGTDAEFSDTHLPWLISAVTHISKAGLQIDTLRIRGGTLTDYRHPDDDQDDFVRLIGKLRNIKNLQVQWGFVDDGLETNLLWRGTAAQSLKVDVYEELMNQALSELTRRTPAVDAAEEEFRDRVWGHCVRIFQCRMAELMSETGLSFVDETGVED